MSLSPVPVRSRPASARLAAACTAALGVLLAAAPAGAQITLGHVDSFEGGTTAGWQVGGAPHPAPPRVEAGGRRGADDHYLRLTSIGGGGPGSRMSAYNVGSAWTGDYRAAGVSGVSMWVNNFGSSDLFLRLGVVDFADQPGPPIHVALSLAPIVLPGGSGWTHVTFSLHPQALGAILGTAGGALRNADELRIYHRAEFGFPPDAIEAELGLDDITAVPEPSTLALLGGGLLALGAAARRRRAR